MPRKKHFLRSHRRVSVAQKALMQQLATANVSTSQQMSVLKLQAGGLENVGCLRRDIYNSQRDMRKYVDGHDANLLKELFEIEKEKNPGFTYTIEEDDEHRLTHFIDDAVLDEEGTEIVREALLSSQKKIAFMRGSRQDGSTSSIQLPISLESQYGLKEPLKVRAKSCGQSHDKRKCPKLMNMSSQDARLYDDDDDGFADECKCLFKYGDDIGKVPDA
ncbi:hypothetical protein RHSIM_Rhsim04G0131200 [Rhododendron simsii]|uniref:Uncharacterized protein n=1 Tax=Rhododendron simsii TaxID=118357 RepID=A0A834LQW5_RHOSS|nr:hypothetical protein RHSIM_Rhsim04G0131200 [Rhododendron simsii]